MIAMTSTRRFCKDSLDKLLPWVFSSEFKITLVLQILYSQTLLMLLDSGGFLFHIIYSPPFSSKNCLSWYDPSPEMPNWVLLMPQQNSNHSQIYREYTTSVCIALVDRHTYRAPYLLTSFQPSFTRNDPNKSTPQYINGDSSRILSLENLPFSVAEAFLSTVCIWHTSRWYIWPKSDILSPKNQRTLFGSLSYLNQHEILHIVHLLFLLDRWEGGLNLLPNFQKGGARQDLNF